ncbi:FliM/FliN family flagellar motor switch protein [Aliarcobacter cryaerophilus]|uniref:FliM/FliN family flagellar motor switch protein n=1 Tax=Aliarcobacter cryaerophilus TaxID=28198 RepID=UPI0009CC2C58|nr:FliM/FliN family flagellar motor switch protein [Aliarcobacter cryaerophilus]OQA75280.1 MAG: Flagellar motor switch protein FliN [Candidatus Dependentiae bacterium ADurb.Bin246]MCT7467533.1 FliM/FliN family flagellar motor switch protein [Aliarcobacter cryaerophilus]MCT7502164.1 FliM/FliN family flagellar motor switch protein [Aliarcobacter cryaerophilus]MCT7522500.1 FliM/FliN family flagellar motor switch protein [Aliarcobacter cryaerophilus]MCT7533461.1 FliM/FliN family flagellar motor sw
MASDLSNVFKNELSNTLEQLLGKKAKISETKKLDDIFESSSFIEADVKFDIKGLSSAIVFYIPTISATKFEYLMLGGMGDLKEDIDDETTDAVNEIVSNICGSFCTASNAQGMPDIVGMKSEIKGTKKVEKSALSGKEIYLFNISLEEDATPILISFEKTFSPFFSLITGVNDEKPVVSTPTAPAAPTITQTQSIVGVPNPSKNLELLYNVRLKLSVRLGTKIVLLKDILRWDVGEIIELEQMVNEPLEILINGVKIGEGEAVIVEGKFGLKIKKIINEDLKLDKIGL